MKTILKVLLNISLIFSLFSITFAGLTLLKVVTPLIVVSGSMEPEIPIGSLIISTKISTEDLNVGDIATLPREDGVLVTHRVITNESNNTSDKARSIIMKGDSNEFEDANPYIQSEALKPLLVVPILGSILAFISNNRLEIIAFLSFGAGIYALLNIIVTLRGSNSRKNNSNKIQKSIKEGAAENE